DHDYNKVIALDAQSGRQEWTYKTDADRPIWSFYQAANGVIVFSTYGDVGKAFPSRLVAVDARSGKQKWHFQSDAYLFGPVVIGKTAFVGTNRAMSYTADPPGKPYGAI